MGSIGTGGKVRRCCLLGLVVLGACASRSEVGSAPATGGIGGGGFVLPEGGRGAGHLSDAASGPAPTPDGNCGNHASTMTLSPADLLVLIDRSGSMVNSIASDDECKASSCSQRWATLLAGMTRVLASSPSSIDWGMKLFSTPGLTGAQGSTPEGCVVSPGAEVPLGKGNTSAILAAINATTPNFNTPTRAAIETAVSYLQGVSDGRPKHILLATDGQPNCALGGAYATEPDMAAALTAIDQALAAGIKVYVIGVGPSTGNLDEMALRGGTEKFYPALSPDALNAALTTIAGIVASCVYDMGVAPPDPDNIGVYLDKNLVPRSATDGWILSGATAVAFTGETCQRVKAGAYKDVQVLFGCPGIISIPTVIP